jgi:tRNA wybutosine-synthesizing protein 1
MKGVKLDDPEIIVEEAIKAQRKLLIGFKGNPKTPKGLFEEAMHPNQAAISLAGEPTLYPKLSGLIGEFHKRGFTTFLVTNGMNPKVLEELNPLSTQLYVTLVANSHEMYCKMTGSCYGKKGFDKLMQTIELLPSLNTRKVLRLTLVKGLNMLGAKEYAEIIEKSSAHFVEAKAYMYVGSSRDRLISENMPTQADIRECSQKIADELGWEIIDEHEQSRVCLIAPEDYKWRKF